MSDYSDFELKIIAQAKKEVNNSPNYRVLENLKHFIQEQIDLACDTDYKFDQWNTPYNRKIFLQEFDDLKQAIKDECNKLFQIIPEQILPAVSENDIVDIAALMDKEQAIFYKAKSDFLAREFSESNIYFLSIFLPLIKQMLKMNKRPTDLFNGKMIDRLKHRQKARVAGGETLHQRRSRDRDEEKKIFKIIYNEMSTEYNWRPKLAKHLALIKFCVVSNVIDIEISKEEKRQKDTPTEKAEQILEQLEELKGDLAEWENFETILSKHKEQEAINTLGGYCNYLSPHKKIDLVNALEALEEKLCSSASIETVCRDLEKSDKMLLEYGANYHTVAQISYWLNENSTLRPFVQDMLLRVRQRLQTSRITSTEK